MRWSWPAWVAITLGALCMILGLYHSSQSGGGSMMMANMNSGWGFTFLAGAILLAAGLHALQASYDSWCGDGGCGCCGDNCSCGDCGDCRGGGGCGCNHCEGCSGGDCCGHCGCGNMQGGDGHEGHDHGPGEHTH